MNSKHVVLIGLFAILWIVSSPASAAAATTEPQTPADRQTTTGESQRNPSTSPVSAMGAPVRPVTTPEPPPPPKIEGSMTGYIDDAIIGSQIRTRFESGWHTQFPDRAEFFYAKCGCYRVLVGSGLPAVDANAPGPQGGVATDLNYQELYIYGEFAPSSRLSFFSEAPVRWIQPKSFVPGTGSFGNQAGFSDLRAGVKASLVNREDNVVTVQLKGYFPTGDGSKGLGTNHYSIEPALLFYRRASRFAVESQFSYWHPIGGSRGVATDTNANPGSFAGDVLSYGIGPSVQVVSNDHVRIAPVIELVGWRVRGGAETVWIAANHIADPVGGTNIVNLKAGFRINVAAHNSIYIGYGHGLTQSVWYENLMRTEYRFSF